MSRTYAKFPEVESERTTQDEPRQHYVTVVVVEVQKISYHRYNLKSKFEIQSKFEIPSQYLKLKIYEHAQTSFEF